MGGAHYSEEFPLLAGVGLYASDISGDGNCLFHALSDQIYGHESNHVEIRERVVERKTHAEYFKLFLDVDTARRAPKRKAHTAGSTVGPTEDAIDKAFAQHLKTMSQPGVYGDNMEISAFAREYNCDVKIYQREFAYVVSGGGDGSKKTAHIAYHTWEHYSSIRNRDGPHTGPPNVTPVPLTEEGRREQERKLGETSYVLPWMEGVVASSLPYIVDPGKIRHVLEKCKGNVDEAVSQLLDENEAEKPKSTFRREDVSRPISPKSTEEDIEDGIKKTLKNDIPNDPISANEPQTQPPTQKPRRDTKREKKLKQKEAKKLRDREWAANKNKETEGATTTITVGIKELHV
ncbi:OTU-domain-containing protein [Morchella conica CCBAS932]|uniref:OTU-domain-containing protein n=1 Tax=Morchella conica CCBAS932 TaxID=1392247 RepID=A0A3N4KEJ3_9PEZI|nr:OTU-domain-containing protein [Morchella conica CCBAS932]